MRQYAPGKKTMSKIDCFAVAGIQSVVDLMLRHYSSMDNGSRIFERGFLVVVPSCYDFYIANEVIAY